jgi:hypothetical protein
LQSQLLSFSASIWVLEKRRQKALEAVLASSWNSFCFPFVLLPKEILARWLERRLLPQGRGVSELAGGAPTREDRTEKKRCKSRELTVFYSSYPLSLSRCIIPPHSASSGILQWLVDDEWPQQQRQRKQETIVVTNVCRKCSKIFILVVTFSTTYAAIYKVT